NRDGARQRRDERARILRARARRRIVNHRGAKRLVSSALISPRAAFPIWYYWGSATRLTSCAEVAQLVEHSTENAGVTGSIPVLGTKTLTTQCLARSAGHFCVEHSERRDAAKITDAFPVVWTTYDGVWDRAKIER